MKSRNGVAIPRETHIRQAPAARLGSAELEVADVRRVVSRWSFSLPDTCKEKRRDDDGEPAFTFPPPGKGKRSGVPHLAGPLGTLRSTAS